MGWKAGGLDGLQNVQSVQSAQGGQARSNPLAQTYFGTCPIMFELAASRSLTPRMRGRRRMRRGVQGGGGDGGADGTSGGCGGGRDETECFFFFRQAYHYRSRSAFKPRVIFLVTT